MVQNTISILIWFSTYRMEHSFDIDSCPWIARVTPGQVSICLRGKNSRTGPTLALRFQTAFFLHGFMVAHLKNGGTAWASLTWLECGSDEHQAPSRDSAIKKYSLFFSLVYNRFKALIWICIFLGGLCYDSFTHLDWERGVQWPCWIKSEMYGTEYAVIVCIYMGVEARGWCQMFS